MTQPGPIVLFGSGETAPGAQRIYHHLFTRLDTPIRVAILETPAGFEPNSADVAGQVAAYLGRHLQNFRPQIEIVPARARGTPYSPEDPALAARLHGANVIFMGPGSPTYTVRQLRGTVVWETVRACHRLGAALVFASAATLAMSRQTLPVYEIYKVGEDLHWKPGLNLLADYGLAASFVSHWNNNDGGERLDTSRCYVGQARFARLVQMLPGGTDEHTLVGIDEKTAISIEPQHCSATVLGAGQATLLRRGEPLVFDAGQSFAMDLLGPVHLPAPSAGIDEAIWRGVVAGRHAAMVTQPPPPVPDATVLALVEARAAARGRADWANADQLRKAIAAQGWRVLDTADGQKLEPA
jgi:hypothetical protein